MQDKIIKLILDKIEQLKVRNFVSNLTNHFEHDPQIYFIGGIVRDAVRSVVEGINYEISDVDIIVCNGELERAIESLEVDFSKTLFGGLRIPIDDSLDIDIWEANKTIRIAPNDKLNQLENYFNDLYLNIDHIAFDPKKSALIDRGCINAIMEKTIELKFSGGEYKPHPIDLSRAVSLIRRTGYEMGDRLKEIILNNRGDVISAILKKSERNHYSEEKKQELISLVEEISPSNRFNRKKGKLL